MLSPTKFKYSLQLIAHKNTPFYHNMRLCVYVWLTARGSSGCWPSFLALFFARIQISVTIIIYMKTSRQQNETNIIIQKVKRTLGDREACTFLWIYSSLGHGHFGLGYVCELRKITMKNWLWHIPDVNVLDKSLPLSLTLSLR